ncbi:hypothetical protein GH714_011147 [Hevea brasiliensis]|uniref:Uncharacterized protein n=1 Tax=Hevea brasiliensis TaxID=3981 RepID=A0A6A6MIA2_HEVBR|nr:hypothetical protein GH714_011147 [Hevea brasiliensis]
MLVSWRLNQNYNGELLVKGVSGECLNHIRVARKEGMRFLDGFESPKLSSGAELVDFGETAENGPAVQVLPSQGHGVWKVKLVINPKQLEEILSEQGNTETLIEKMRMAASSASLEPRQSKSSRGLAWMPSL